MRSKRSRTVDQFYTEAVAEVNALAPSAPPVVLPKASASKPVARHLAWLNIVPMFVPLLVALLASCLIFADFRHCTYWDNYWDREQQNFVQQILARVGVSATTPVFARCTGSRWSLPKACQLITNENVINTHCTVEAAQFCSAWSAYVKITTKETPQ